jgi:hypothetical protein
MRRLSVRLGDVEILGAWLADAADAEDVAALLEHGAATVRSLGIDRAIAQAAFAAREAERCGE